MPRPRPVDVLVVGAGIIGASVAWRLARFCRVTLCDANVVGGESSWAGAGMLVPGSEFTSACAELSFALESLKLWPSFAGDLESETGARIDFRLCGSLELAASEEEYVQLAARAESQGRIGIECNAVPARELKRMMPGLTGGNAGAVLYPREGQVDPRTVTAALRLACLRLDVEIRERTKVAALRAAGGRIQAELADGQRIDAGRVVISAGAWSNLIETDAEVPPMPRCYPVRGHLAGYSLRPGSLSHILRFHHTYVVQRSTGYTIAGTSEEDAGFDRSVDPTILADIAARAHALAGGILPASPHLGWVGFRPGAEGGPFLHRLGELPIWLAYGHYRNGILLAPASAALVADQIIASLETS